MTTRLTILLVILTVAGGCFSSTPKEEHFYNLHGPLAVKTDGTGPTLVVVNFASAAGYDSQRLAYRLSDHEVRYYGYRQWVTEPARMVTEWTFRHLRATRLFSAVEAPDKLRRPDAILEASIDVIEEVDKGETWDARLAMTFVVRDGETERVLLRHAFDTTRACARRDPAEVAREVSNILAKELKRLAERIKTTVASRRRAAPSSGPARSTDG